MVTALQRIVATFFKGAGWTTKSALVERRSEPNSFPGVLKKWCVTSLNEEGRTNPALLKVIRLFETEVDHERATR
jgi:hypothetical protein